MSSPPKWLFWGHCVVSCTFPMQTSDKVFNQSINLSSILFKSKLSFSYFWQCMQWIQQWWLKLPLFSPTLDFLVVRLICNICVACERASIAEWLENLPGKPMILTVAGSILGQVSDVSNSPELKFDTFTPLHLFEDFSY